MHSTKVVTSSVDISIQCSRCKHSFKLQNTLVQNTPITTTPPLCDFLICPRCGKNIGIHRVYVKEVDNEIHGK